MPIHSRSFLNFKTLVIFVVILLISSLLLHMVMHHEHPEGIFGDGVQAAFHGEDKKWWILFLLAYVFFCRALLRTARNYTITRDTSYIQRHSATTYLLALHDPLRYILRKGIIQGKIF